LGRCAAWRRPVLLSAVELLHRGVLSADGQQHGPPAQLHVSGGQGSVLLCGLRHHQFLHRWLVVGVLLLHPPSGGDRGDGRPKRLPYGLET